MKKIIVAFVLTSVIYCELVPVANAQSVEYDFYQKVLLLVILCAVALIGLSGSVLFLSFRKLKIRNREIKNLYELRDTFINSYNHLIYLKDENLKYIFANKALRHFCGKEEHEIIGKETCGLREFAEMQKETDYFVLRNKTSCIREIFWNDRVYRATKFPVKLINGSFGVGAYIEDVTESYNNKIKLAVERNKFLQTLISIGDGVMVVDIDGKVTILNKAAEELTGWTIGQAQGRHYKDVFVLLNGEEKALVNDPIKEALMTGAVREPDKHAVLVSKNGTRHHLESRAAPVRDDKGVTTGVVLVFRDVTGEVEQRKKIEYLSFHDALTGLYNRLFFEEEIRRLDTKRNLPVSVIIADMNGLKLANDIFGHAVGDLFLKKAAETFKKVCRSEDIIARVGGDEFAVLLPKTTEEEVQKIVSRIKEQFSNVTFKTLKGSISVGSYTKTNENDDILQVLKNAEDRMYLEKTLDRSKIKSTAVKAIIESLHANSPREKGHSQRVSSLCESLGKAMGLSEIEIRKLREAGFLHDIGKIVLDESLLNKNDVLTEHESKEIKQHPVIGYRILNYFDDTLDLAESILTHHERWDGNGYPKGLKGEQIPKLARIIAVAEYYDAITNKMENKALSKAEAVEEMKKQAGARLDPDIVDIFIKMLLEKINN